MSKANPPRLASSSRTLRVLIVDDERTLADTLALIVNMSGHDSLAVYTGLEAVDAMQTFNPDVVLSDVTMPGLNGFELARHLAKNFPACKMLLMSGIDWAIELAEQHLERGQFAELLTKPVMPQKILDFVARCSESAALQ
jgi:CheY-like chemotaxis protein